MELLNFISGQALHKFKGSALGFFIGLLFPYSQDLMFKRHHLFKKGLINLNIKRLCHLNDEPVIEAVGADESV